MEGSGTLDLFSQHLDAAVLKIHDLEKITTADTETSCVDFKRAETTLHALRGDIQLAQALLEGLRSILASNEVEVHCSNPQHAFELAVKEHRINELSALLRVKDEAEATQLDTISQSQVTREVSKCKSEDSDLPLSKRDIYGLTGVGGSSLCDVFEDDINIAQLTSIITRFKMPLVKIELNDVKIKHVQNVSFTDDSQVLREYMANNWPSSQILIVDSPIWLDLHAWIVRPGHRLQASVQPAHSAGDEWIPDPQFAKVNGQVGELFFRSVTERNLVYAGSYRALVLPNIQPAQLSKLTGRARSSLVESIKLYEGYGPRVGHFGRMKSLIESGVISVECLGLQFLAFNEDIHAGMVETRNLRLDEDMRAKRPLEISALDSNPPGCKRGEFKKLKTGHPLQERETLPDTKEGELEEPVFLIFKSECEV